SVTCFFSTAWAYAAALSASESASATIAVWAVFISSSRRPQAQPSLAFYRATARPREAARLMCAFRPQPGATPRASVRQGDQKVDTDYESGKDQHPGEHARHVEHGFGLLDNVAQARRRAEILADNRAHHGKTDGDVERGEHPGQRRGPVDVAHERALAHPQHARIRQHGRTDFLDALIDVEEHDEEHQRDAERDLRPDPETEPKREDRRQHDPRQRVDHLDVRIE